LSTMFCEHRLVLRNQLGRTSCSAMDAALQFSRDKHFAASAASK